LALDSLWVQKKAFLLTPLVKALKVPFGPQKVVIAQNWVLPLIRRPGFLDWGSKKLWVSNLGLPLGEKPFLGLKSWVEFWDLSSDTWVKYFSHRGRGELCVEGFPILCYFGCCNTGMIVGNLNYEGGKKSPLVIIVRRKIEYPAWRRRRVFL